MSEDQSRTTTPVLPVTDIGIYIITIYPNYLYCFYKDTTFMCIIDKNHSIMY